MHVIIRVLSRRATATAGAVLVFVLGCWTMLDPSLLRVLTAAGFAVFTLLSQMLIAWAER